jgi:hypothetical protein
VALFLFSFGVKSEGVGQCPSGTTHHIDTLTIDTCDYIVDMCIDCTPTHPGTVSINSITPIDSSCVSSLTPEQQINQVMAEVENWAYMYFEVCPSGIPPCDMDVKRITYNYPVCWVVVYDAVNERNWYYSCDDAYCRVVYDICWKMPEMELQKTQISKTPVNFPPSCEFVEAASITFPTTHNGESDCFVIHTVCNP